MVFIQTSLQSWWHKDLDVKVSHPLLQTRKWKFVKYTSLIVTVPGGARIGGWICWLPRLPFILLFHRRQTISVSIGLAILGLLIAFAFYYFSCVYTHTPICTCVWVLMKSETALDPLELEFQVVVNCPLWILGTGSEFFVRAASPRAQGLPPQWCY